MRGMMQENRWLELHDSQVESLIIDGRNLVLIFSAAYIHKSPGRPGRDAGTGWRQRIRLEFKKASLDGKPDKLPDKIDDGELDLAGKADGGISLPFSWEKPVRLSLIFQSGNEIQIYGDRLTVTEMGEADYVENFPGVA